MRLITFFLVGGALVLLVGATGCIFIGPSWGPEHVFSVEPAPPFLTEEMAVAKASQMLAIEGCRVNEWQPARAQSPIKAPDGRPDEYIVRYRDFVRVSFVNGKKQRTYDVRLNGTRVICSRFHGM